MLTFLQATDRCENYLREAQEAFIKLPSAGNFRGLQHWMLAYQALRHVRGNDNQITLAAILADKVTKDWPETIVQAKHGIGLTEVIKFDASTL